MGAINGVGGVLYARTLVDLSSGEKVDIKDLTSGDDGLKIGTTSTTAMAGNKTPTASERGGVLRQAAQADSTATDVAGVVSDLNALLAKLRASGVLTT